MTAESHFCGQPSPCSPAHIYHRTTAEVEGIAGLTLPLTACVHMHAHTHPAFSQGSKECYSTMTGTWWVLKKVFIGWVHVLMNCQGTQGESLEKSVDIMTASWTK